MLFFLYTSFNFTLTPNLLKVFKIILLLGWMLTPCHIKLLKDKNEKLSDKIERKTVRQAERQTGGQTEGQTERKPRKKWRDKP